MPHFDANGAQLHYIDEGTGAETIVFSHGLLFSNRMFANQISHFRRHYRCVAFDHRGQGESMVTADGYDMDSLTADAAELIERLGVGPCHFVGLSMGGFVGLRLGIRRPDLLRSLILMETSADPESPENLPRYKMLNLVARWLGLGVVMGRVMPIMFGRSFLEDGSRADERKMWRKQLAGNHRIGITRAVTGVINRQGVYEEIPKIAKPTLIIVGDEDVATTPDKAERMHAAIGGSKLVEIPRAGHSSTIEEPDAVNKAIETFLNDMRQKTA